MFGTINAQAFWPGSVGAVFHLRDRLFDICTAAVALPLPAGLDHRLCHESLRPPASAEFEGAAVARCHVVPAAVFRSGSANSHSGCYETGQGTDYPVPVLQCSY